jgi:hypothetical protein
MFSLDNALNFRYNHIMKVLNPETMKAIRSAFLQAGYTRTGILDRIRAGDFPALKASDIPILMRHTQSGSALDTLIRLFLVEVPCNKDAVSEAVTPMDVSDWAEAGLITMNGSEVSAAVKVLPFNDLLLAFDLPSMLTGDSGRDYVMGLGASTLTLANLTIRKASSLTLDLGAGCGLQALLAGSHSEKVIATDINERAVAFARFNAALNGIENVQCRRGDFFEPVKGVEFDLIMSNPPYVISPEYEYSYCSAGLAGDELCRKIVQEAPALLAEGGFCQVLCNWAEFDGSPWMDRIRGWVEGSLCDAWVMRSQSRDITSYASTWIRHTEPKENGITRERFEKWMRYYDHMGITGIGAGIVTLRRRTGGQNWFRADEAPKKMLGPCGENILMGFALRDFLESSTDSDLLAARFVLSADARLKRVCTPASGGWKDTALKLSLERGFVYSGDIDGVMANFLIACTGQKTLREVLQETAADLGVAPDSISDAFMTMIRPLVEQGFLLPVTARQP